MFVPDPFIYLRIRGREYIAMTDLEIDRARKQASHCAVLSFSKYQKKLKEAGKKRPGMADVIAAVMREKGVRRATVPDSFPLGLAGELKKKGISVRARPGSFFPEREHKSSDEVKKISAALMMAEVGMAEAIQVLRASKISRDRKLMYHNIP